MGIIDVDVHLIPTNISKNLGEEATCTWNHGEQPEQDTSFCDSPVHAQASASSSTTAFSGPPPHPRQSKSSIRIQE